MSLSLPAEEDDRRCREIHPDGHPKAGLQCEGYHTRDSSFCNIHKEGTAKLNQQRSRSAARVRDMQERLSGKHYSIRKISDVQELLEDTINGVLQNSFKSNPKAPAMLGVFIPLAYKMAKEQQGKGHSDAAFIQMDADNQVELQLSDEEMDRYLAGDDSIKIEVLESLKDTNKIKIHKRKDKNIVDVDLSSVEPENVKVNAGELARISCKTDIPLTTQQAKGLFGRNMAAVRSDQAAGIDATGFGELFDKDSLPYGNHKFKGKYENIETDKGIARMSLWFTCQYCGLKKPNVVKELCEKSPKQP